MTPSGRPRNSSIDDHLLRAAAELVTERGYAGITVEEVVARAGTTKPAFYRRFRDLADLVPTLLTSRHGTDEDIDTGSLIGDLVEVQRRQRLLFTDPVVVRGVCGWLAAIDATPERGESFLAEYLAPRRAFTGVILQRAVDRGEIATGVDPGWIADLLSGPFMMRAMLPGMPPIDDRLVVQSVHAALDALGYWGERPGLPA